MPQKGTGTSLLVPFGARPQGEVMFLSSLWLLLCAPNLLWVELGRKERTKFEIVLLKMGPLVPGSMDRIHSP